MPMSFIHGRIRRQTIERGQRIEDVRNARPEIRNGLERAEHFLKLGFWVHAIKDPLGAVVMNQQAIASHFGPH